MAKKQTVAERVKERLGSGKFSGRVTSFHYAVRHESGLFVDHDGNGFPKLYSLGKEAEMVARVGGDDCRVVKVRVTVEVIEPKEEGK